MGSLSRSLVLVCATGCKFTPPPATTGDDADVILVDAADAPAICMSWTPKHFEPCMAGSPMPAPMLVETASPYTYDTTTAGGVLTDKTNTVIQTSSVTYTQADSSVVAVWNLDALTVPANVRINVIGTKPLLVASWSTLVVDGSLDVGSHTTEVDMAGGIDATTRLGAAANLACTTELGKLGQDAVITGGSGGGGGGAFGGGGGGGGNGDGGGISGAGPSTPLAAPPTVIRGGCRGGTSGTAGGGAVAPATATTLANPGDGGGALELAALSSIVVGATGIIASGGGAGAGSPQGSGVGGGGGGSGGYLGFDSAIVTIAGMVAANGGGGGGSAPFADDGGQGEDGQPSAVRANGGPAYPVTCGQPGAQGAAAATHDGSAAVGVDGCGGGGGGGGVGFVLVWSPAFTRPGTASPGVTLNP